MKKIELKGSPKEKKVREWFNDKHNGKVPGGAKVIELFKVFEVEVPGISYGCLNGTMKKIVEEGHVNMSATPGSDSVVDDKPIKTNIVKVEDMEFPDFGLHPTGKKIDELMSDHVEGGGTYGGTVNIVIGESGVGKSTLLLDMLAAMEVFNPDIKVLYISSEMTKNDIKFYYAKTPAMGKVPTLLLMDHVKDGTLDKALEQEFKKNYDVILLDSHQDCVVKLKEIKGWKATYAESWLIGLMIDAAENTGAAVFPIQHMTKGGQYVGSTYLKHATTAMMEILFDDQGQRYVTFSKNRRGGSAVGKRLYFSLDENGDVIYNADRFKETEELKEIENSEAVRKLDLANKFEETFFSAGKAIEAKPAGDEVTRTDESPSTESPVAEELEAEGVETITVVKKVKEEEE